MRLKTIERMMLVSFRRVILCAVLWFASGQAQAQQGTLTLACKGTMTVPEILRNYAVTRQRDSTRLDGHYRQLH